MRMAEVGVPHSSSKTLAVRGGRIAPCFKPACPSQLRWPCHLCSHSQIKTESRWYQAQRPVVSWQITYWWHTPLFSSTRLHASHKIRVKMRGKSFSYVMEWLDWFFFRFYTVLKRQGAELSKKVKDEVYLLPTFLLVFEPRTQGWQSSTMYLGTAGPHTLIGWECGDGSYHKLKEYPTGLQTGQHDRDLFLNGSRSQHYQPITEWFVLTRGDVIDLTLLNVFVHHAAMQILFSSGNHIKITQAWIHTIIGMNLKATVGWENSGQILLTVYSQGQKVWWTTA